MNMHQCAQNVRCDRPLRCPAGRDLTEHQGNPVVKSGGSIQKNRVDNVLEQTEPGSTDSFYKFDSNCELDRKNFVPLK